MHHDDAPRTNVTGHTTLLTSFVHLPHPSEKRMIRARSALAVKLSSRLVNPRACGAHTLAYIIFPIQRPIDASLLREAVRPMAMCFP